MCDADIDPYRGYTKQQIAEMRKAMMCKDEITACRPDAKEDDIDPPPAPQNHLQNGAAIFGNTPQRLTF